MKIDMNRLVPGREGKPMTTEEGELLTLKMVCVNALDGVKPEGNTMDRKGKQAAIMVDILVHDTPDLESEQVAIVKEMIGISGYRPWVCHMAGLMLEGKDLPEIPAKGEGDEAT